MRRDHLPTVADLKRMPAGDRGPRLRALAAHYGEKLAQAEANPSEHRKCGVTRHRRAMALIDRMNGVVGA